MNIEFHYYITYLIAARAGFDPDESYIIAYSSQFVDDNTVAYEINSGTLESYKNYKSQTINIFKPQTKLFRIYPIFHFIPGGIFEGESRKDGKLHFLNATPDSENSRKILHAAFETENLYRIGIALHAYSDTWAHQNFTGYFEEFNVLKSPLQRPWAIFRFLGIPIGHVNAKNSPDKINESWEDFRLLDQSRNNNEIFLEAITRMYEELYYFKNLQGIDLTKEKNDLINDLSYALRINNKEDRIEFYKDLSIKKPYGRKELRNYNSEEWMAKAVLEDLRSFRFRGRNIILKYILTYISSNLSILNKYTWKDREKYKKTSWFKFQEAVKDHQKEAISILNKTQIGELELDNW